MNNLLILLVLGAASCPGGYMYPNPAIHRDADRRLALFVEWRYGDPWILVTDPLGYKLGGCEPHQICRLDRAQRTALAITLNGAGLKVSRFHAPGRAPRLPVRWTNPRLQLSLVAIEGRRLELHFDGLPQAWIVRLNDAETQELLDSLFPERHEPRKTGAPYRL